MRQVFLTDRVFQGLNCFQEVNVQEICPDYPHRSHHFDWFVEQLDCVIELHGAQHYKPINFGGIGYDDLMVQFRKGLFRDSLKEQAARAAGLTYLAIPHTAELTGELILRLIMES